MTKQELCKIKAGFFLFFLFLLMPLNLFADEGSIIERIDIKGNKRIDEATVRYYISSKVEGKYSAITIREDIKRIYQIGHFEDVRVESEKTERGLILTYIVIEKPSISEIKIEGNDDVSEEDIKEKITIGKGDIIDLSVINENIKEILKLYKEKGFYFAKITIDKEVTKNNQVEVIFTIKENKKIKIKKIDFLGNDNISDRVLKKYMETSKKGWFSWLSGSGVYKKEVLKADILRIESFYRDTGYAKVLVYDPEVDIDEEKKRIIIKIKINEGSRYIVKHIDIKGDDSFSREELLSQIKLKKGDIYNRTLLREDIFRINKLYSKKGYTYSDIIPVINLFDKDKTVEIKMEASKGKKFYVGKISIEGNEKTRDRVIRREFRFKEGEIFDSWKLERSRERIFNLSFFEDVKLDVRRGDEDDLLDIIVNVEERQTGQFSISAGYSSVENLVFQSQVALNNLLGRGQRLSLTAEKSDLRKQFVLDFYEPRIFDREISAGFDISFKNEDNFNNDTKSTGAGIRLGKAIGEYSWGSLKYRFQDQSIKLKGDSKGNIFNPAGNIKISSLTPIISRDTRDNFLNPSKGTKLITKFEYAGGILGGKNFYKTSFEISRYFPIAFKFVGLLHGKIGFSEAFGSDPRLPITERYFLGGPYTMRGFSFGDIGPKDDDSDPLGGNKMLLFNAEIQYPFSNTVRGMLFYDRGNVFGEGIDVSTTDDDFSLINMRHNYGFGIRLYTPIGPIGLSYGFKLDKKEGETPTEFNFSIGSPF